jgi:hypothetical protein
VRWPRYGTILLDLVTHRAADPLPDCSAPTVPAWLDRHPTITLVCCDLNNLYADGIREGAAKPVQVVDRFHLVHNLRQAPEAFLGNDWVALQATAAGTAMPLTPADGPIPVSRCM